MKNTYLGLVKTLPMRIYLLQSITELLGALVMSPLNAIKSMDCNFICVTCVLCLVVRHKYGTCGQ